MAEPGKELAKVFLVKYKGKIIGGSICLFSKESAYLWFSGGMRKTYAFLYPGILAVWAPITYAYEKGYAHLEFMDAGLPFKSTVTGTLYSALAASRAVHAAGSASVGSG